MKSISQSKIILSIHNEVSLKSIQEETDSKVVLHCLDVTNNLKATIVISSPSAENGKYYNGHDGNGDIMVHIIVTIE